MLNNLTAYFRIRPIPLVYIVKSIAWEFFAFVFHTVLHLVFVSIVFTYLIFLTFKYSFYVNSRQKKRNMMKNVVVVPFVQTICVRLVDGSLYSGLEACRLLVCQTCRTNAAVVLSALTNRTGCRYIHCFALDCPS